MFDFKIERTLAEISGNSHGSKRLTLTSWNGSRSKLDFRNWIDTPDGPKPGKGLTLTEEEALKLAIAIYSYMEEQDPQEAEKAQEA